MYESHTNEHVLFKFLTDLHALLDDKTVWGGHLGSETLMRRHKNTRTRIACITVLEKRKSELEQRKSEDAGPSIEELPEEVERREIVDNDIAKYCVLTSQCVREILCKLSDHRDVDNAGQSEITRQD